MTIELAKYGDDLYLINLPGTDQSEAIKLGDPVEFLEEVFRFYLTNWTILPTEIKNGFLVALKDIIWRALLRDLSLRWKDNNNNV
jgi:hypothetical protein